MKYIKPFLAHEEQADLLIDRGLVAGRSFLIHKAWGKTLPALAQKEVTIRRFANVLGIAPGIIVGRMQKEGLLTWVSGLNHLEIRCMGMEWRRASQK